MPRRPTILAAALALPAIAVIFWMLTPAPRPDTEAAPAQSFSKDGTSNMASRTASYPARTTARTSAISADRSKIVRRSDEDFPELTTAPASAPALPVSTTPSISPRYTLTTQPNAATLAHRLEGQPPLAPDERIRVLPAQAAAATSAKTVPTDSAAVLLRLDATLHDPAAWVESGKLTGEKQEAMKTRIAADFAAEVADAAKEPEAAAKTFDDTWKDARAKANWEYQKFFGGEAANRAGMSAGRAAVSRQ